MAAKPKSKATKALALWHSVATTSLKELPVDLSSRQTAILLTVYLEPGPHSIKSLSEKLSISKPAVCRAIDAMEDAKLLRRAQDKKDRRNMFVLATAKSSSYLQQLAGIIQDASRIAA